MANDDLVNQVMGEVLKRIGNTQKNNDQRVAVDLPKTGEFIGVNPLGDTIGLVIPNLDTQIHVGMDIDPKYRAIGIIGARTGAGPHAFAVDEGLKATNSELLKFEMARDTKGGAGHGCLIIVGAEDVSDARRAVEVTLKELDRTFGDVYANDAGHLEFQYTARAAGGLAKALGAPLGSAFGITVGAPAAIGVVLADTAVKASEIKVMGVSSPAKGTSYSNEVIALFSGDPGAVHQAVIAAREVGLQLLGAMGDTPASLSTPYI